LGSKINCRNRRAWTSAREFWTCSAAK
jgi:hypothetical protein